VSPQEIIGIGRRHLVAVAVVVVLAAGLFYNFTHRNPGYVDSGVVAFVAPKNDGGLFGYGQSLLAADQVMQARLTGAQGQQEVRQAGGTANFDVELANQNNEEFPSYSDPYATVSTVSNDPAEAARTYAAVIQVLTRNLQEVQAQEGAPAKTWIQLQVISDSPGPTLQKGSKIRIFAGLAILAVILAFMLAVFLDRHPVRLRPRVLALSRHTARSHQP
jgi:hypothetical protein